MPPTELMQAETVRLSVIFVCLFFGIVSGVPIGYFLHCWLAESARRDNREENASNALRSARMWDGN